MRKRNIKSTLVIKHDSVIVNIIEKINGKFLPIWNYSTNRNNISNAIVSLKDEHRKLFGADIKSVGVVYQPNTKKEWEIINLNKRHVLTNKEFSEIDMKNIMQSISSIAQRSGYQVIKTQPYNFEISDISGRVKQYARLPFGRVGNEINISYTITYLSNDAYDYIDSLLNQFNIKRFNVYVSPEIYINNNEVVEDNEVTFIHVGNNYSFIANVKNNTVQSFREVPQINYEKLVEGISKTLDISNNEAKCDLHMSNTVQTDKSILIDKIVDKYSQYIVDKLTDDERNKSLVISGQLLKLKIATDKINSLIDRDVNLAKPKLYLEGSAKYKDAYSINKSINITNILTGKKTVQEFVQTIPENIHEAYNIRYNTKRKGLLSKLWEKIGGYNE